MSEYLKEKTKIDTIMADLKAILKRDNIPINDLTLRAGLVGLEMASRYCVQALDSYALDIGIPIEKANRMRRKLLDVLPTPKEGS